MRVIVTFYAFDKASSEIFENKDFRYIHESLFKICSTYRLTSIEEVTATEFLPLSNLQSFQK